LLQQIDIEYTYKERYDQRREGIFPTEVSNRLVVGNREKFARNHHCCKQEPEYKVYNKKFNKGIFAINNTDNYVFQKGGRKKFCFVLTEKEKRGII